MEVDGEKIDSNAYSRQIYAIGESAMLKLRKSSVLISGLGGVGLEIAKNLILGGVRRVGLHDTKKVEWRDLSAQYYVSESDLGNNRADACFTKLEELNDSVQCTLHTEELSEELVSKFELIVLTDSSFARQLEVNEWTRKHGRKFISADARGLFSYSFVDLGPRFRASGDVHTLEGTHHGFEDGDHVQFSEVRGMDELNTCEPRKITVLKPNVFNIGPIPEGWSSYTEGGRARQVKVPILVDFQPLKDSLTKPECVIWDFAHFEAPEHLHGLWQALYAFEQKHGRSPGVRSVEDAKLLKEELAAITKAEIPEEWIKNFSFQAKGNLQPVTSLIGGITAQEAMKAVTHHTMPQRQFLYTHHLEALPGSYSSFDADKLTEEDCKPRNSRYDGQAAVFGWPFQEAILQQRWFIVGAGAIGCELLKNFAMMGVGCSAKGQVKITDMDQIELSNLNRQFLFRRNDIGGKKSEVASRAVKQFNQDLNIEALTERVAEDTEHVFTDDFFSGLSGVANALDNVDARRYMDRRCVYYELPLLESGTMGAKGNTQVVYPHVTETFPICTLKHFPYEIQHTIQWGRGQFEDLFTNPAEKDCIKWARDLFQHNYHNDIAQLLHNFPADQLTSGGTKFWSGTKRCPHTLNFDINEKFHFDFVYAASILRAEQYKLQPITDRQQFAQVATGYSPPAFQPQKGVKIATTEAEAQAEGGEDGESGSDPESHIDGLKLALARLQLSNAELLNVIDFEKDDDTNHHVEFVTAASNLRAENYDIPQADAMKTKQIAGRIIPALSTTTAVVAGLVCIELYKVIEKEGRISKAPLERFKNGFLNLAGPFYAFSEPGKAPKKKYGEREFTLWDRLEIRGPKTLKEMIDWVKSETGLEVSMLSSGVSLLYAFFQPPAKVKERMAKNVLDVVTEVTRKQIPDHRRTLVFDAMTTGEDDEDVDIPFIKYYV
ncbi:hypothetical protein M3Y99_01268400 [Aphelenchoides fujianensis]|nr:hypothetical protein M3Y99_01268400 [Aphelenchoides fujianensis]